MAQSGKNRTMNTFQDGMRMDVDKLNQPNSSFRYGLNGRLIYNRDGTYAWETERGNKLSINYKPDNDSGLAGTNYKPIGWTGKSNLIVIFSTDEVSGYSEIGLLIINENGVSQYRTMFNDINDPNSELLNFNVKNQIEARFIYETDKLLRAYWVDGVKNNSNQPRSYTFSYDNTLPENDLNAYTPLSNSTHDINLQSSFNMGLIKYNKTISGGGNKLSGSYQYTYRLVTNVGYRTPWKPLTNPVILTTDQVTGSNPWEYEMEGSGIDTGKAIEIEIKGIDQRYDEIEVCYVYLETDSIPTQAAIFEITPIDGTTMTFVDSTMDGEPITIDELPVFFQGIRAAKTINIKDESLYLGNTIESSFELNDLEAILENITVTPYFKNIRSDEWSIAAFEDGRDVIGIGSKPPIHRQSVVANSTSTMMLHDQPGGTEDYSVIDEYSNYKGTQVSHLNKGYFRGETYRYGIVFFDLLGYQSFVYHLFDLETPEQYSNTYNATRLKSDGSTVAVPVVTLAERAWTTCNFGDYFDDDAINGLSGSDTAVSYLRIMGVKVGGIDISTVKSQISGFMIVRAKCEPQILMQGLVMPCVKENDTTRPAPYGHDRWYDITNGANPSTITDVGDMQLNAAVSIVTGSEYELRPNTSVFYPTDLDFGYAQLPNVQTADRIKLVSTCYQVGHDCVGDEDDASGCWDYLNQYFTWEDDTASLLPPYTSFADRGREGVRKLYRTKNDSQGYADLPATINDPYPAHGVEADVSFLINLGLGDTIDNYEPGLDLDNTTEFDNGFHMGYEKFKQHKAWGKGNSVFIKHGDFTPFDGSGVAKPWNPFFQTPSSELADATYMGSWIMNYLRPNNNPYGGVSRSSLERTVFFSVGHFQPVNNPTFDAQGMPATDIFNGIEIWGGDCILDYMGFARLYPRMRDPFNWNNTPFEYGIGELYPLESRVHHPLRNAPSQQDPVFSNVGLRPQKELQVGGTEWPDGIFYAAESELREEFDINSVLFYEETVMLYAPKPLRFNAIDHFPVRWRYTPSKFYGDEIDSWRIFQVNDFDDLNGEYGEITSSIFIFNQIYSFQESAFGRLRASDRALIESANQGSLTTGIGEKLDGIDYINTEFGNQHQWSLFSSGKAAYWIEVNQRKICRFAQDGYISLSDVRGLHQWSENELRNFENQDTPVDGFGISGIFDYQNNVAIWSFIRDKKLKISDVNSLYIVSTETRVDNYVYTIINNLDLVEIDPTSAIVDVVIPKNTSINGNNYLFVFYITNISIGNVLQVKQIDGAAFTGIVNINPAETFKFYRNDINDDWSTVLVNKAEITEKYYSTLSFNEISNAFVGFHSYSANIFITAKNFTLAHSENHTNDLWVLNIGRVTEYYNQKYNSILEPIVADQAMYAKVFDTFKGNANFNLVNTLEEIHMITDTTYNLLSLTADTRKAFKENVLRLPLRTTDQLYRTRGKQLTEILIINNTDLKLTQISSITTDFRISNRI